MCWAQLPQALVTAPYYSGLLSPLQSPYSLASDSALLGIVCHVFPRMSELGMSTLNILSVLIWRFRGSDLPGSHSD